MIWDYGLIKPASLYPMQRCFYPFLDALELHRLHGNHDWRTPEWHDTMTHQWSFREGQATVPGEGNPDVSTWHHDGGKVNPFKYIAVWASKSPSQFLLPDDTIYMPDDNHLIVVANREIKHRSGRDLKDRHFVRIIPPRDWEPLEEYLIWPT